MGAPAALVECVTVVESQRYGRLVFIGYSDSRRCRDAESRGIRVFYAEHGERVACFVRVEDAGVVCGSSPQLGGGGVAEAPGNTRGVASGLGSNNKKSSRGAGGMSFDDILDAVARARRGTRRAMAASFSLSREVVDAIYRIAEERGVNPSRVAEALLRYALAQLGYLRE